MRLPWFIYWLALVAAWACVVIITSRVNAQTGHTHEGDVGQFYLTWGQPGNRGFGCCDRTHCRPAAALRRNRAGYEVQIPGRDWWYPVGNDIWEDAQPDPRESPDGANHVCLMKG